VRARSLPREPMGPSLRRALVLGIAVAAAAAGFWGVRAYQQGRANLDACGGIEPGGQRSDLIKTLGAPQVAKANPARTRLVLSFTSPFFAEKPIRAVVNIRDDVVMEVDCGDGRIKTYDKY
jgi:hypothetical protein